MTSNSHLSTFQEELDSYLRNSQRCFMGICGLGGCGKTTLARSISAHREGVQVFETDWYIAYSSSHRRSLVIKALQTDDRETLSFWADPTNWYDWPRLLADLSTLRAGGQTRLENAWRQQSGELDLTVDISMSNNSVLIVDGIYLLHHEIRTLLDRVIFLDVAPAIANSRTGDRDKSRIDESYLAFKRSIVDSFDLPYIERYRAAIDRIIS